MERKNILLLFILLLGFILRLLCLNKVVWFDEALSIYAARKTLSGLIHFSLYSHELQPPLYAIILKLLWGAAHSIIVLRFFSLICGLGTIYVSYKLASRLFSERVGLLACALVACSEYLIYYSVELRCYSAWTFLSILSVYLFMKLIERPSAVNSASFIICAVLSVYLHYFGAFLLACNVLFYGISKKTAKMRPGKLSVIYLVIFILLLPQLVFFYHRYLNFSSLEQNYINYPPSLKNLFFVFYDYSNHYIVVAFIVLMSGLVILTQLKRGLRENSALDSEKNNLSPPKLYICLIYLLLPLFSVFCYSLGKYSFFAGRHLQPFFIFYYFALAAATGLIGNKKIRRITVALLCCLFFASAFGYAVRVYFRESSDELKKITVFLNGRLEEGDLVVANDLHNQLQLFNYLGRPIRLAIEKEAEQYYLLRSFRLGKEEVITDFSGLGARRRFWAVILKRFIRYPQWLAQNNEYKIEKCWEGAVYELWLVSDKKLR